MWILYDSLENVFCSCKRHLKSRMSPCSKGWPWSLVAQQGHPWWDEVETVPLGSHSARGSQISAVGATHRTRQGLHLPFTSNHRLLSSRGNMPNATQLAKWCQMGPKRNIFKGLFVWECIIAEARNVMYGMHGWAFNLPKSKPHFLSGRE